MKVTGPTEPRMTGASAANAAPGAQPAEEARDAQRNEETRRAGRHDQAALSGRARLLQKARAAFEAAPELRSDRVEQLRRALTQGDYRIDLRSLVEKLLNLVK